MLSTDALRNKLIDQILLTKNKKLLQTINKMLQSASIEEKIELNSYQLEMIQMGLKDVEENNTISESDLDKEDAKWMS